MNGPGTALQALYSLQSQVKHAGTISEKLCSNGQCIPLSDVYLYLEDVSTALQAVKTSSSKECPVDTQGLHDEFKEACESLGYLLAQYSDKEDQNRLRVSDMDAFCVTLHQRLQPFVTELTEAGFFKQTIVTKPQLASPQSGSLPHTLLLNSPTTAEGHSPDIPRSESCSPTPHQAAPVWVMGVPIVERTESSKSYTPSAPPAEPAQKYSPPRPIPMETSKTNPPQYSPSKVKTQVGCLPPISRVLWQLPSQITLPCISMLRRAEPDKTATLLSLLRSHRAARNPSDLTATSLPHLSHLDFKRQPPLTPASVDALAPLLPLLVSVQSVSLVGEDLATASFRKLIRKLSLLERLSEVHLEDMKLGASDARVLARHLPDVARLRTLNLRSNALGDDGVALLATRLRATSMLQVLDLSGNGFGLTGAKTLARALPTAPLLSSLNISQNPIGDAGAAALAATLIRMSNMVAIDLSEVAIGAHGMCALAPQLPHSQKLKSVALGGNEVARGGAEALAPHLAYMHALEELRLPDCRLGESDECMETLSHDLGQVRTLKVLNLSGNGITAAGGAALATHALTALSNLHLLSLGRNPLGDAAVAALATSLEASSALPCLQSLDLCSCGLGDGGARDLAAVLDRAHAIADVVVDGNAALGDVGAGALAEVLCRRSTLRLLSVVQCGVSPVGVEVATGAWSEGGGNLEALKIDTSIETLRAHLSHFTTTPQTSQPNTLSSITSLALSTKPPPLESSAEEPGTAESAPPLPLRTLAPHLRHLPHLQSLSLKACHMAAPDAEALAPHLAFFTGLSALDLSQNCIGDDGAVALGAALGSLTALKALNVSYNGLSGAGAKALLSGHFGTCLEAVDLRGNHVKGGFGFGKQHSVNGAVSAACKRSPGLKVSL